MFSGSHNTLVIRIFSFDSHASGSFLLLPTSVINFCVEKESLRDGGRRLLLLWPMQKKVAGDAVKKITDLIQNGANPSIEDKNGLTPLIVLVSKGGMDFIETLRKVVKAFIEHYGNDVLNHESSKGLTPMIASFRLEWYYLEWCN